MCPSHNTSIRLLLLCFFPAVSHSGFCINGGVRFRKLARNYAMLINAIKTGGGGEIRCVFYTINAIESLNCVVRKATTRTGCFRMMWLP